MSNDSYRYAYSLFLLCAEEGMAESVYNDFTLFYDLIGSNENLYKLLINETIKKEDKKNVLKNIFDSKDNILLKNFINLLIDKNRIAEIKLIYLNFKDLYLKNKGILNVEVVSAVKLSDEMRLSLKDKLSDKFNKDIILTERVDKDIIGGIVLYIDGNMMDLSVKNELDTIKRQLKETKIV